MSKGTRAILMLQGAYYAITGVWAITDIQSFSDFTNYQGDFFLKHTAAILFTILGFIFIYGAKNKIGLVFLPAGATAAGIACIELLYVPKIGNPLPFWADFLLEITFAGVLLFTWLWMKIRKREN